MKTNPVILSKNNMCSAVKALDTKKKHKKSTNAGEFK